MKTAHGHENGHEHHQHVSWTTYKRRAELESL